MSGGATLAPQQRALLALIKGRPVPADAYIERVRDSRGLETVRMVARWWRGYDLERLAPLTSRALKHAGRFDRVLDQLGSDPALPAGSGALALHVLRLHLEDADPLIAAIAATELALTLVGGGDDATHSIPWPRDPWPVLRALLARRAPGAGATVRFNLTVSRALSGWLAAEQDT